MTRDGEVGTSAYAPWARFYDAFFPEEPWPLLFVSKVLPEETGRLLDVGCGTGSLALRLADLGWSVTGIDADAGMVEEARRKAGGRRNPSFGHAEMLSFLRGTADASWDAVLCWGNTLVHLSRPQAEEFLRQSWRILVPGGRLILQILNYDRILRERPAELPRLRAATGEVLVRSYDYRSDGTIGFRVRVEGSDGTPETETTLHPLGRTALERMLDEAGFVGLRIFGDFDASPFRDDAFLLLCVARRP